MIETLIESAWCYCVLASFFGGLISLGYTIFLKNVEDRILSFLATVHFIVFFIVLVFKE